MTRRSALSRLGSEMFIGSILTLILVACSGGAQDTTTLSLPTGNDIAIGVLNFAPLSNCPNGGVTVESGVDSNQDHVLQTSELTSTQFVCNGLNGNNGTNGLNGSDGISNFKALLLISHELPGINCATGGSVVNVGLDLNQDNILGRNEITSFNYICNGANGASGASGNTGATGATGLGGPTGANGATGAAGSNGTNGSAGATGLNGATGAAGSNGTNGSAGATGSKGETGAAGSNGTNGINGFNSLASITAESVGSDHCVYGGAKTSSGLDLNANNTLDPSEITSTTYICTGATGSQGAKGDAGVSVAGLSAYAYVYNLAAQNVAIDAAVLFDSNGSMLGFTHTVGTSFITVNNSGLYSILFSTSATEPSQFAVFVNSVAVPSSVYGSGAGAQQNNGQLIISLATADIISLVNHSSAAAVGLPSLMGGTQANVNASVLIEKLN